MEQTDENKTMLQVMLDNIENDNIWNDSGSYKLDNCPFEEVFPAMQAYATLATTAQQSIIDGQKERIEELEKGISEIRELIYLKSNGDIATKALEIANKLYQYNQPKP